MLVYSIPRALLKQCLLQKLQNLQSKHPRGLQARAVEEAIRRRAQVNPIGAEDNGVETCVVVEDKVALGEDVVEIVDQEEGILVVVVAKNCVVFCSKRTVKA